MIFLKRPILLFGYLLISLALFACTSAAQPTDVTMEKGQESVISEQSTETQVMEEKNSDDQVMDDQSTDEPVMADKPSEEPAMTDKPTEDLAMIEKTTSDQTMAELPAFFSATMTDAATGVNFKLEEYKGKVILVETMAMWCSRCLQQQRQVSILHGLLGEREDFFSLGLDVDLNETVGDLQGYVSSNGFDWKYAVASPEIAREIGQLFGDQFLNPSSTPMFIIDRKGQVHPLPFGVKSAEELQQALQPFLDEGM